MMDYEAVKKTEQINKYNSEELRKKKGIERNKKKADRAATSSEQLLEFT